MNKAILIGNLGADPEIRHTADGGQVVNLRLATSRKWKDREGNQKEDTQWHRVVFFGKRAEVAGQYLAKGSKIAAEGRIETRKWQDQNGNDKYTTEIVGDNFEFLDSRREQTQKTQEGLDDDIPF